MLHEGFAEVIALYLIATVRLKKRQLGLIFDAFGYNFEIQVLCHTDYGCRDSRIVGTLRDIPDERTVYFQLADWELLQVASEE